MDYEKLLKETDAKFRELERSVNVMENQIASTKIEMTKIQGEYRLLKRLRDEAAKAKEPNAPAEA
jgi:peptidoglycan hydrolase CwlO-like protein